MESRYDGKIRMKDVEKMEECWFAGKHTEKGKEPLECLKCKRMKGKNILDSPENHDLNVFLQGYRLAILEIAVYVKEFTPSQIDMIQGIELRMKCAIDRGISVKQLQQGLEALASQLLSDKLKGKI